MKLIPEITWMDRINRIGSRLTVNVEQLWISRVGNALHGIPQIDHRIVENINWRY